MLSFQPFADVQRAFDIVTVALGIKSFTPSIISVTDISVSPGDAPSNARNLSSDDANNNSNNKPEGVKQGSELSPGNGSCVVQLLPGPESNL
jgi:hypothetical protein